MNYQEFLKGKRVTLMGLGLLGRGVGDAKFLAKYCEHLIVTDLKTEEQLKESVDQLKEFKNITFRLGSHEFEDFRGRDLIVKGAGVPLNSAYIREAEKWQIRITMASALFAKFFPGIIIGVTGTKGKSTVSYLIHHVIQSLGKRVHLGGNVRGVSTLEILEEGKFGDIAVLELDSWQLQGFGYEKISPLISVFTNFFEDHMTYYSGSMEDYFEDKAQIFMYQENGGHLVTENGVIENPLFKKKKYKGTIHVREDVDYGCLPEIQNLIGSHNLDNIAYVSLVADILKIGKSEFYSACKTFSGAPGRLEKVHTAHGVDYFNDTNGTVPVAVIQGVTALKNKYKNVYLIAGGTDKSLSLESLVKTLNHKVSEVALLKGTGTDVLLKEEITFPYTIHEDLNTAVHRLAGIAKEGDCIVLSPGFSSFGMFKNEYDRGDQFNAIVRKI